jgi:hypothetical protein
LALKNTIRATDGPSANTILLAAAREIMRMAKLNVFLLME